MASAVFLAASMAWSALPAAAANITYSGSDTEGHFSISYSITTDGTLGPLELSNIVSSSATFTGDAASGFGGPLTVTNTVYFQDSNQGDASPVSATLSSLLFNFAGGGYFLISLGGGGVGDPAPPAGFEGLLFALAGAQTTDADSDVFHYNQSTPDVPNPQPDREIDNVGNPDFYIQPGTFTSVAPTEQAFATVEAVAVPEPASWSLLALGIAGMSVCARTRRRAEQDRRC